MCFFCNRLKAERSLRSLPSEHCLDQGHETDLLSEEGFIAFENVLVANEELGT